MNALVHANIAIIKTIDNDMSLINKKRRRLISAKVNNLKEKDYSC